MISKKFLWALSTYLSIPSGFYSLPWAVHYDSERGIMTLEYRSSLKPLLKWLFVVSCHLELLLFPLFRLCQKVMNGDYQGIDAIVIIHGFDIIGWGIPMYYLLCIMYYRKDIPMLFNKAMKLDQDLRRKYFIGRPFLNILELGFAVVLPSCYVQGCCFSLLSLALPDLPFFHGSLLTEWGWPWWAQLPVKIYQAYMVVHCWSIIGPLWLIILTVMFSCTGWMYELPAEPIKTRKQCTSGKLRQAPMNSIMVYKEITLVSQVMLEMGKTAILATSFIAGALVVVFMGYATIREFKTTPFPEYLVYPTAWIFVVLMFVFVGVEAECFHESSTEYIAQLKVHPNKVVRRIGGSLRPLVVKVSEIQNWEKGWTVEKLDHAVNTIVDLLVGLN